MSKRSRRHYTVEEKAAVVRRHLVDKIAVSSLCEEYSLQPSVFYHWLKQVTDNLAAALTPPTSKKLDRREKQLTVENTQLKAKLIKKDSVIAEVSEEMIKLKKELGEL